METKTQTPSFTVSLRGYDREEVDEYLDSLAEALARVEEAEEQTRRLQAHVARCNGRIKELEDKIRADTPRTGMALGERIGLLLHEAEEAAADLRSRAEADRSRIVAGAEAKAAEADELMHSVTAQAEDQARRIEAVAKGEAAEIVSEAEARAAARTRQIEQWAEQVISHTRAEEARMFVEQQQAKDAAAAELHALAEQRRAAAATLLSVREAIGQAVGLIEDRDESSAGPKGAIGPNGSSDATGGTDPDAGADEPAPAMSDSVPPGHGAEDMPEAEQLEAKLDAWVAGAPDES
jgi:DivIVA domain-containing protein